MCSSDLLQSTRKEELTASAYMQKMKAFADAMAAAGAPVSDDELVDYIITGLGPVYNSITASLTVGNQLVAYTDFYLHVLSFESLQAQQAQATEEWASSVNAAMRPNPYGSQGGNRPRMQDFNPAYQGGGRPAGNPSQQGQGRFGGNGGFNGGYNGGNGGRNGGGGGRNGGGGARNGGRNGGGNGDGGGRRWWPRCQICRNWGHETYDCCNRYDHDYRADSRAGDRKRVV